MQNDQKYCRCASHLSRAVCLQRRRCARLLVCATSAQCWRPEGSRSRACQSLTNWVFFVTHKPNQARTGQIKRKRAAKKHRLPTSKRRKLLVCYLLFRSSSGLFQKKRT